MQSVPGMCWTCSQSEINRPLCSASRTTGTRTAAAKPESLFLADTTDIPATVCPVSALVDALKSNSRLGDHMKTQSALCSSMQSDICFLLLQVYRLFLGKYVDEALVNLQCQSLSLSQRALAFSGVFHQICPE